MTKKPTMPGLRGIEHIGITVPNLEEAAQFFIDVLGCEPIYDSGPFKFPDDDWMMRQLNVHPRAEVKKIRFLRCGHGSNLELFEYSSPDQRAEQPKNSDIGGHHLCFYTDDFEASLAWLRDNGVRILGEPLTKNDGPNAGITWVYFQAPWGMHFELVSFPNGKGYEKTTDRHLWSPVNPAA